VSQVGQVSSKSWCNWSSSAKLLPGVVEITLSLNIEQVGGKVTNSKSVSHWNALLFVEVEEHQRLIDELVHDRGENHSEHGAQEV